RVLRGAPSPSARAVPAVAARQWRATPRARTRSRTRRATPGTLRVTPECCAARCARSAVQVRIDAEALAPAMHLHARLPHGARDVGEVPVVLRERREELAAHALVALREAARRLLLRRERLGERGREVRDVDGLALRQRDRAREALFELARVQRPS